MATNAVTLDFSKAQPITPRKAQGGVTLDFSKAVPLVAGSNGPLPGVPRATIPAGLQGPPSQPMKLGSVMDTLGNVGTHLKNMVTGPVHAVIDAPADATESTIAGAPQGRLGLAAYRLTAKPTVDALADAVRLRNAGGPQSSLTAGSTYDENGQNIPTAGSKLVDAIPMYGPWARNVENESHQKGILPAAAGLITDAAPALLAPVAGKPIEALGGKMRDAGVGVVNRTVGALKADFRHGGNPGQGYFQAGFGPSLSMRSIANKAATAKSATGATLGNLYDAATDSGYKIPVQDVAGAIRTPVQKAMQVTMGPGGTGDVAPYEQFSASFRPPLQAAAENGGFTPSELFAVKKNVAANTAWNDPTQLNLNKVRQQTTGAIGGVLTDHLPDTAPLNSTYQNLGALETRASSRALTDSSPLTHLVTKTAIGGTGAALGMATHNPLYGAMTAAGGLALDSVPVKTAVASGMYYGGKAVAGIGKGLQSVFSPPEIPGKPTFSFAANPPQLEANVPGNAGYGADYTAGPIPQRSPITGQAPMPRLALPETTTLGTPQPMIGVKANQYPPLAKDFARTRVKPTEFKGPTENPFALPKGYLAPPTRRGGKA